MLRSFSPIRLAWKPNGVLQATARLYTMRLKSTYVPQPSAKIRRNKTKEELAQERLEVQLKSDNRFVRWGAIARTEKFTKGMTKYLIGAYIFFLIYGLYFMKKMYAKEKELERLEARQSNGEANEYEKLRVKELRGKLRTRDELKLVKYRELPQDENQSSTQFDGIELENNDENKTNKKILPARDTTEFYDFKAADYDEGVNFEEKAIMMGRRRKWLMKHCQGDVLEIACGTGRNLKYADLSKINSITFLDASEKMMELTHEKFRQEFPNFKKAAFVVGKAENLVDLASGAKTEGVDPETKVRYDTIVEAFGLCSLENPVKALKNFEKLLKPGGRIVLLEHGRGTYGFINKILDDRAEKRLETWGCRWNLDLGEILDDSGLEIVEEKRTHLGTTWCIVAKKKGDVKKNTEVGFVEKYFGSSIKSKIEAYDNASKATDQKKDP
ncbi:LANO_0G16798g1_1 [Lachancea nothofagi CBS 11611]|uniref:LANO_0G16798g1_1 n=1 Tax=Lachancea nothofagi CBS 11611 TaxID=1266666 RepID=A0A1G4KKK3_9SACH|nr:LANO_0G16798g1_1 [Lachancea nothofagi CBS 11611]